MRSALIDVAQALGLRAAAVLLLHSPFSGLILLAAMALTPTNLFGALVGLCVGEWLARVVTDERDWRIPNIRANAMLGGLSAAWLLAPNGLLLSLGWAFIPGVAAATGLLAAALGRAFDGSVVPILSAAFLLVFGALLTLFPGLSLSAATAELTWAYPIDAIGWIDSLLRSMGMIVFDPRPLTGALVLAAIALSSPLLLVHGVVGWAAGIMTALIMQYLGFNWRWLLSAHNSFVAAMLIGAVFNLPSKSTLVLSALAGVISALVALGTQITFVGTAWAFQPIPSVLTIWLVLLAFFGRNPQRGLATNCEPSIAPHRAARNARISRARFGKGERLLIAPVAGHLLVTQSFDGSFTHRGPWRHALDFERPEDAESILGQVVFSPAPGVVERVIDGVADNPPGGNNYRDNWGNHVIIRLEDGRAWVLLAHLGCGSIRVKPGDRLEYGTALGTVGNSGRSPVPHLHMHVQTGSLAGAPTIPFQLANVVTVENSQRVWRSHHLPAAGETVVGATAERRTLGSTTAIAPGVATWQVDTTGNVAGFEDNGTAIETIEIEIDVSGNHVYSHHGGTLTYHADPDALRLYGSSGRLGVVLSLLEKALPAIPYAATADMRWREIGVAAPTGWLDQIAELAAPYGWNVDRMVRLRGIENGGDEVSIEAEFEHPRALEPLTITVKVGEHRGPLEILARFTTGTLNARLVAFEARLG